MIKENKMKNSSVYSHKIDWSDVLLQDAVQLFNPPSVAILYHLRLVALSLTDIQFLIPITFIPLKLGGSPFALTILYTI
jgi:hypothetical protein